MVMRCLNVTGCSDHPEPESQASGASWPDVSVHPEPKSQAMGASWPDVGEFMKDECDDQCKDEHFGPTYTINRETKKDLGAAIAKPLVCKLRSTLSSSDEEQSRASNRVMRQFWQRRCWRHHWLRNIRL